MQPIARYLDHAVLKPDYTREQAEAEIRRGLNYHVRTVCVRPCDLEMALEMCRGTDTQAIVVLDFPHGCATTGAKALLSAEYARMGAAEIDMVANIAMLKSHQWAEATQDIAAVVRAAGKTPVKVILETCLLTPEEITQATHCAAEAGAAFVKTSTGFSTGGATEEAVRLMLDAAQGRLEVKASGGIRDFAQAKRYIDMGVTRLGVGSGSTAAICDGQGVGDGY